MTKHLYIIVDVSGSMNEMGKIHIQRNLCRYAVQMQLIEQEKYSKYNIHFFQWAQNVSEIVLQSDGDIPPLNAEGSSNLSPLSDFLSKQLNENRRLMTLILSDGNFPSDDIETFKKQINTLSNIFIQTVAVGADADLFNLKKISTNNSVHLSENIATAIDATIFGSDEASAIPPKSMAEILQSETTESEALEEN